MAAVEAEGLVKSYNKGAVQAVREVSFSVEKGELFGLIGPDGAGKTSIFRILTTLLLPEGGRAQVSGFDVVKDYKAIRERVGYMPGRFSLYPDLSVEENLSFFARLFNTTVKENYGLIKDIYRQLEPFKTRRADKLSGGMKQKLALCCALIHRPEVLFLDEPTTGVDVVSRREFWEMLKALKQQGITILVSTPYMDEAQLCERIALLQSGRILSIDAPARIIAQYPRPLFAVRASQMGRLQSALRANKEIKSCYSFGDTHHITFQGSPETSPLELTRNLQQAGFTDIVIRPVSPGIEDCFIELMN